MNNKSKYTKECIKCCKDVSNLNVIPVDQHVAQRDHDFNTSEKFTIIEQLKNAKAK